MAKEKMTSQDRFVMITAIICISGLEAIALMKGINGAALAVVCAIVAGLGGYVIPNDFFKGKKKEGDSGG